MNKKSKKVSVSIYITKNTFNLLKEKEMPLEIKNKRTGKVNACAVMGNSLRCGHCDQEIVKDTTWLALDDPYYCLIHETCLSMFEFNEMARTAQGKGREKAREEIDRNLEALNEMISKPWFKRRGVPEKYKHALQQILMLHQSLRTSNVIKEESNKEEIKE